MNDDLVGLLVGLAVTVLPVAVCAWWGVRNQRRLRREAYEQLVLRITIDINPFMEAIAVIGHAFATFAPAFERLGEVLAKATVPFAEIEAAWRAAQENDDAPGG